MPSKNLRWILPINLVILVFYTILIAKDVDKDSQGYYVLAYFLPIALHSIILFLSLVIFFHYKKKKIAQQLLLSLFAVLIIGFSLCTSIDSLI